jgi:hypothetical protein
MSAKRNSPAGNPNTDLPGLNDPPASEADAASLGDSDREDSAEPPVSDSVGDDTGETKDGDDLPPETGGEDALPMYVFLCRVETVEEGRRVIYEPGQAPCLLNEQQLADFGSCVKAVAPDAV